MIIDLNNIRSIVEKNMIDGKLGKTPNDIMSQGDIWKASANAVAQMTLRDWRDWMAQILVDILTDASSSGGSLSTDGTFGGGNRVAGSGNILLDVPSGKTVTISTNNSQQVVITNANITLTSGSNLFQVSAVDGVRYSLNGGFSWTNLT